MGNMSLAPTKAPRHSVGTAGLTGGSLFLSVFSELKPMVGWNMYVPRAPTNETEVLLLVELPEVAYLPIAGSGQVFDVFSIINQLHERLVDECKVAYVRGGIST